jgi:hypothetical protein
MPTARRASGACRRTVRASAAPPRRLAPWRDHNVGALERGWLDDVRPLAPRTVVVMCLIAVGSARFGNDGLFRWSALGSLVTATHG